MAGQEAVGQLNAVCSSDQPIASMNSCVMMRIRSRATANPDLDKSITIRSQLA
jgi:hypothetical protein